MSHRSPLPERDSEIENEKLLVEAATTGDLETLLSLLEKGVSVDAEEFVKNLFYASKNYMTPLQVACSFGHTECAQALIDYDADVNAKDRFDVTALHLAAEYGNYHCLKALLEANAECSLPTKYSKSGCYTAVPHLGGTTPLHLAAATNQVDCVQELIQYGADYNAVDERGRTSLYIAAQFGYNDCVLAHLKNAVGRNILSIPSTETSDTPLHFAVSHSMLDCVQALLESGSDVNHLNNAGCSPLHLAVSPTREDRAVSMDMLRMMVLKGYNTNINLRDGTNKVPLHYCCFNDQHPRARNDEMAKFLIAYGADVNISNRGVNLMEYVIRSLVPADFDVLKYIVRSLLHVPHLTKLRVVPDTYVSMNRQYFPRLFAHNTNPQERGVPVEMAHRTGGVFLMRDRLMNLSLLGPTPPPRVAESTNPHLDEKLVWYERIASNPRTLQHCCRYAIRKALGPRSMKYIEQLPLPNAIKPYLLLEKD